MSNFVIGRRELYMLPTRVGWYFGLVLIALFAIAVKYDNQAAFMMLFILASTGMVAMLYTHNNVIGLSIDSQPSKPVFLGETALFSVRVVNSSRSHRSAVWLVCDGFHKLLDIPPNQHRQVDLKLPTMHRGYLKCAPVTLTSQYPVGIFFCWTKRFHPEQHCLVYPQPLDLTHFPDNSDNSGQRQPQEKAQAGAEDYNGMKPYQAGDRIRDVHWPSLAKTHKLVTIQHENQTSNRVNLSWFALPAHFDTEDKLSQLCYWVVCADRDNIKYQLEMPNHTVQFNSGLAHYHKCLSVLALWS